jgi:hypothetical protein
MKLSHRDNVTFAVQKDASTSYKLKVTSGSIGALHSQLSETGGLSGRDVTGKSITFRVYIWEVLCHVKRLREVCCTACAHQTLVPKTLDMVFFRVMRTLESLTKEALHHHQSVLLRAG